MNEAINQDKEGERAASVLRELPERGDLHGPGWAALETATLVWVGVQAGSPQSRGQTLGKCWVCRQCKTPALGQMPALSRAALGKCHDLSLPRAENGPPTELLYGLYE